MDSNDVEVEVEGSWLYGWVRGWSRREDGWWATVTYSTGPGQNRLDAFPADRVRQIRYCPWYQGNHECLGWDGCRLGLTAAEPGEEH